MYITRDIPTATSNPTLVYSVQCTVYSVQCTARISLSILLPTLYLTSEDLLVLSLLGVGDHVLYSGGGLAPQLGQSHSQPSSLTSHCVVLVNQSINNTVVNSYGLQPPHVS